MILPLDAPISPSPDDARQWLARELSRAEYARYSSLIEAWLRRKFNELLGKGVDKVPEGAPNLFTAVFVGLLVLALVWVIMRIRVSPLEKEERRSASVMVDPALSGDDYRRLAREQLQRGETNAALMSAFRAIVADLDRRTVLGDRPGRTAQEVALAISKVFPGQAEGVHQSANWFDEAAYDNRRTGAPGQVEAVLSLGDEIGRTRPQFSDALPSGPPPDATGMRP